MRQGTQPSSGLESMAKPSHRAGGPDRAASSLGGKACTVGNRVQGCKAPQEPAWQCLNHKQQLNAATSQVAFLPRSLQSRLGQSLAFQ